MSIVHYPVQPEPPGLLAASPVQPALRVPLAQLGPQASRVLLGRRETQVLKVLLVHRAMAQPVHRVLLVHRETQVVLKVIQVLKVLLGQRETQVALRELLVSKAILAHREILEPKETLVHREIPELRDSKEQLGLRASKVIPELKVSRVILDFRDSREQPEHKVLREIPVLRDLGLLAHKALRVPLVFVAYRAQEDLLARKVSREIQAHKERLD